MNWQGKRVLVTGGAGQIGSHLTAKLVAAGADVAVADNLWRGRKSNLIVHGAPVIDFERNFHEVDLVDYGNCVTAVRDREIVFHLADVVAGINYVFGNQFSLFNTNVVMNSNMIRTSVSAGVQKYIYVGTACSYPDHMQQELNPPPLREEDAYPASPESSYGWSKLMGEYECELCLQESLMDVGILRLHNVYGPHCELSRERSQVIPSLIRKAINHPREEFIVWGSGNQRRAFAYVDDVIDALFSVVDKGMGKGVIQIGPDFSTSIREIAEMVVSITGRDIPIHYDTTMPEGDMDRVADWSKARDVLGWSPRTGIAAGLARTYEWCEAYLTENA